VTANASAPAINASTPRKPFMAAFPLDIFIDRRPRALSAVAEALAHVP
jgi:hypothetical protein